MRFRAHPWLPVLGLSALCVAAIGGLIAYRSRGTWDATRMASALPRENAVIFYADLAAIRNANLLSVVAGTKSVEELDYRKFVSETGFDYKTDLDRLAISFRDRSRYAIVQGRFNWQQIRRYALANGAQCINAVCEVKGQGLDNSVSFYPIEGAALALASGVTPGAVYEIAPNRKPLQTQDGWPPNAPVWIWVPGSVWRDQGRLPTGARLFASALGLTESTTFTIEPGADAKKLTLNFVAACANEADARKVLQQLDEATQLLRKMLTREKLNPKPSDLANLLINGQFQLENGTRVKGQWPLETSLIQAIAEGNVE